MRPWRVIVADDEPLARRGVRQLLARHQGFEVIRECRDGLETLAAVAGGDVDLVFLDIAMPGLNGLQAARSLAGPGAPVIVFLTAHSHHAVAAFEAAAIDYLVKPVAAARFARTIQRVTAMLQARHAATAEPVVTASNRTGTVILKASAIDWISGSNHYARIWQGRRSHLVRETLDGLEARLAGAGFLRVHRSAMVRLAAVHRLERRPAGRGVAVLQSGVGVAVARRRMPALAAALRRAGGR